MSGTDIEKLLGLIEDAIHREDFSSAHIDAQELVKLGYPNAQELSKRMYSFSMHSTTEIKTVTSQGVSTKEHALAVFKKIVGRPQSQE